MMTFMSHSSKRVVVTLTSIYSYVYSAKLSEFYDTRFPTCLPVVSIDIEATVGDSYGIKPDLSLETGRGEEKNLQEWRLEFLEIQETGTRLEQE